MKQRRQPPRGKKPRRPAPARGGRPDQRNSRPQIDDKHLGDPKMTIEDRKAAQLAKWRKELGLDEEG